MELLNKVKKELEKSKNYDFSDEKFSGEVLSIIYDVVYATEKIITSNNSNLTLSEWAELAAKINNREDYDTYIGYITKAFESKSILESDFEALKLLAINQLTNVNKQITK